ncbi:MAG: succinylglutamate-semialdehyde dehydrogenase [Gammaproteobacteria bacterium]|nr:succinylglutamate-semialdehyde dehydrogenase [Gammaproteobacteria bacterium]
MTTLHQPTGKHYIDGHWITGSGTSFISTNPVNQHPIWQGHNAMPPEVSAAFETALHHAHAWASLSTNTRIQYLEQFASCVQNKSEQLSTLISLETGKPYWEASTETAAVIQKIKLSIKAYHERTSPSTSAIDDTNQSLRYKPHGVVAVLGAFNFPAHLSNGHIVPALLAGNTVIYKPSEYTPYVAEFIMQCWHDSKLPKGVLNLIQGNAETAHALIETPIHAVCFTGSYQTGLAIHQQLSHRPEVLLALEMGGNNPLIIDDNITNIPAAVYNTLLSSFLTTGQRCTSARRLIIPDSPTGKQFLQQLLTATQALKIGAPNKTPTPFMGPVIHKNQAQKLINVQKNLITLGANALLEMQYIQDNTALISPGILDMRSVYNPPDEEIFGPLIQLYYYHDFDEALVLANQTKYGLAAGLFSDNKAHYAQFYQTIRAGLINWNKPTTGASSALPFGGVGFSGNHRASAYFAADYAAYPIASLEANTLDFPDNPLPGIHLEAS